MFQKNNVVERKNRETHLSNFILRQNFILGVNTKNESTIHNVFSPLAWLSFSMGVFPLRNVDHLKVSIWGGLRFMYGCIWLVAFHSLGIGIVLQFETNIWMRAFLPYVLARRILIIIWCYYYSFLHNLFQTIVSIDNNLKKLEYPHFDSYEMRRSGKVSLFIGICYVVITLMAGMYQRLVFDGLNVYGMLVDLTGFLVNCAREVFIITFIFVCYNLSLRFRHIRNLWNVAIKRSALGTFRRELKQNEDSVLEEVRLCHFKLCQGVVQMNAVYGVPLATYFCMILLEMLFDLYQFAYMVNTTIGVPIIFNTMNTLTIVAVAVVSDKLVNSAHDILLDLSTVPMTYLHPKCQLQVQIFVNQIVAIPVLVSAAGFCVVNKGFLVSILMSLTTYFIVLVQFSSQLRTFTDQFLNITSS